MDSSTHSAVSSAPQCRPSDCNANSVMNLALLDPPRWGWSAAGAVVDLLTPHERARRKSTREAFLKKLKRKEARKKAPAADVLALSASTSSEMPPLPSSLKPPETTTKQPPVRPEMNHVVGEASQNGLCNTVVLNSEPAFLNSVPPEAAAAAAVVAPREQNEANGSRSSVVSGPTCPPEASKPEKQLVLGPAQAPGSTVPTLARLDNPNAHAKEPPAKTEEPPRTNRPSSDRKERTIEIRALNANQTVDMYTYHRGREGCEPRDAETGHLFCDVEKTDTNYAWEPDKTKIMVTVCFPLEDEPDEVENDANQDEKRGESCGAQYREVIEWNLADPRSQTPLSFATTIAEEFGLSVDQMLDLASSIQKQIDEHVRTQASYRPPLTIKDPLGNFRSPSVLLGHPLAGPVQPYTGLNQTIPGGVQLPFELAQLSSECAANIPTQMLNASDALESSLDANSDAPSADPEYRAEVQRRARLESAREIAALLEQGNDKPRRALVKMCDIACHICRNRRARGARFGCGFTSHGMCELHVSTKLGIALPESDEVPSPIDYCPVCCLECPCTKCSRKLESLAIVLKEKAIEQQTTAEGAIYDDLFQLCRKGFVKISRQASRDNDTKKTRRQSSTGKELSATTVSKVPISEFPREVCGGRDLDPGTLDDYRTVYRHDGIFLREVTAAEALNGDEIKKATDAPADSEKEKSLSSRQATEGSVSGEGIALEDGNVDYCHVCKKAGNMFCCDRCPRAFHRECMKPDAVTTEGEWECEVCSEENEGIAEDLIDGSGSLDLICGSFKEFEQSAGLTESLQILSMIHEMAGKLIEYDFGAIFAVPVDAKSVPGYAALIKNPMDLGTIRSKLVNGSYTNLYNNSKSWDDVIVAALEDIELVWHNCFTFNLEGSSVYRMAEVQLRKNKNIQKRSFDHLLSESIKERVLSYVHECEKERGNMPKADLATAKRFQDRRNTARNKITVPYSIGRTAKSVAVHDPDTGYVVKIYSTAKSACMAAACLAGLGHPVEFKNFAETTLRTVLRKSSEDPSLLLFGYRWLYLEDLQAKSVSFAEPEVSALEAPPDGRGIFTMKDGDDLYTYKSIDEALSNPELPREVPVDAIRRKLVECPIGEWRSIVGRSWKRRLPLQDQNANSDSKEDATAMKDHETFMGHTKNPFPSDVVVVKQDLVSRTFLLGFDSVNGAFKDWLGAKADCPQPGFREQDDIAYFTLHYLDGNRNVDGVVWRRREPSDTQGSGSAEVGNENSSQVAGEDSSRVDASTLLDSAGNSVVVQDKMLNNNSYPELEVDIVEGRPTLVASTTSVPIFSPVVPKQDQKQGMALASRLIEAAKDQNPHSDVAERRSPLEKNVLTVDDTHATGSNGLSSQIPCAKRKREDDGIAVDSSLISEKKAMISMA